MLHWFWCKKVWSPVYQIFLLSSKMIFFNSPPGFMKGLSTFFFWIGQLSWPWQDMNVLQSKETELEKEKQNKKCQAWHEHCVKVIINKPLFMSWFIHSWKQFRMTELILNPVQIHQIHHLSYHNKPPTSEPARVKKKPTCSFMLVADRYSLVFVDVYIFNYIFFHRTRPLTTTMKFLLLEEITSSF